MSDEIKVLIVDDSRIFRGAVEEALKADPGIQVIGSVRNGVKALEFVAEKRPDVITLDVEMPDMDGLETLKEIEKVNASNPDLKPIGVIMLSSFTRKGSDITIEALSNGAFDFIPKPEGASANESVEVLRAELVGKIRAYSSRYLKNKVPPKSPSAATLTSRRPVTAAPKSSSSKVKAVLIGVSTGGPRALIDLLPDLCEKIDLPVLIVQHMPPTFTESLASNLNNKVSHEVKEAADGELIIPKRIYIAPGGKHMVMRKQNEGYVTVINEQPPERGCRPSVDVLFRSTGMVMGGDVVAVILTGMGDDGVKGISSLKRLGAYIIAQDEASSIVWGMPGSAVESGNVDYVLPLKEIAGKVSELVNKG